MVCKHLAELESALLAAGYPVTFRGKAWSDNCREWVYFDVILDVDAVKKKIKLPACVSVSENLDPKSGEERGFYCKDCQDGVMGYLKSQRGSYP